MMISSNNYERFQVQNNPIHFNVWGRKRSFIQPHYSEGNAKRINSSFQDEEDNQFIKQVDKSIVFCGSCYELK